MMEIQSNKLDLERIIRKLQNFVKESLAGKNSAFKVMIMLVTVTLLFFLFSAHFKFHTVNYEIGDIIHLDYISPIDYSVDNDEKTERKIKEKVSRLPAVFIVNPKTEEIFNENIRVVVSSLEKIKNAPGLSIYGRINWIREDYPFFRLSLQQWEALFAIINYDEITNLITLKVSPYMKTGISRERAEFIDNLERWNKNRNSIVVIHPNGKEITKNVSEIVPLSEVKEALFEDHNFPPGIIRFVVQLLSHYLSTNLEFNMQQTAKRAEVLAQSLPPERDSFIKGQIVLRRGEIYTNQDKKVIDTLNNYLSTRVTVKRVTGLAMFILLLFLLLIFYVRRFKRAHFRANEGYLVMFFNLMIFLAAILAVKYFSEISEDTFLSGFSLPFSLFTIIVILFIDVEFAIFSSLIISIITAFFFGYNLDILLYGFVNSLFTVYITRNINKRSTLFYDFLLIGIVSMLVPVSIGLLKGFNAGIIMSNIAAVMVGNLFSYILLISIMPFFESILDIPTRFQLIELISGEHPALKNLTLIAPGTYQHSLGVANMSEAAAVEIGADPITAKVGAMFHDIGKIKNPGYFIENQFTKKNPHDKLSPIMSVKYIRQHVISGYQLSLDYMLPKPVRKIILEHHGTSFMKYFYNKAKLQLKKGEIKELDESEFMYHGNKPTFKESAIVMLADRVEAKSRVLTNYKYSTVKKMVMETLYEALIDEEQLANCPISLQELNRVASSFIKTIQTMYHKRIEYDEDNKN